MMACIVYLNKIFWYIEYIGVWPDLDPHHPIIIHTMPASPLPGRAVYFIKSIGTYRYHKADTHIEMKDKQYF